MQEYTSAHQKEGKASFDHVYDAPDPREYFEALGGLDYRIPEHGKRLFTAILEARGLRGAKVVDLCCSYGINGALLKCDLDLEDLYNRYRSPQLRGLSSEKLAESDRRFYRERQREEAPAVVGLDAAKNAVNYSNRAGLLDEGFAENLEENEPSARLREAVRDARLITITGGVGYISERTFDRVLGCVEGEKPWVAAMALRWVDFESFAEAFSHHGLVTERLEGHTFPQRRFADASEKEYVCSELAKMGIDTAGKEDEGCYHADFYLARPVESSERPVHHLLSSALV